MFSNLTSYFFGGSPAAEQSTITAAAVVGADGKVDEMKSTTSNVSSGVAVLETKNDVVGRTDVEVDEDDDWLMIDSSAGPEDEIMEEVKEDVLQPLKSINSTTTAALPTGLGMEESWIIAPTPTTIPCLVESAMEVSPMETLLIEHASMSVYKKLESPIRSLKKPSSESPQKLPLPSPPSDLSSKPEIFSKPEAPTIEEQTDEVQFTRSQDKKEVKKSTSNQNSKPRAKQPHKPPAIPFILKQKAQKSTAVPEPPKTYSSVVKAKPISVPQKNKKSAKPEIVPNKLQKVKSKKASETKKVVAKPLGEIQNVTTPIITNETPKAPKPIKKSLPPMNRVVESNIKELYPSHVYPMDMRPFVEDFQSSNNTRQLREMISSQRRSQLAVTRAKRQARKNAINAEIIDEMKSEVAMMEQQKENNIVEMRRQEQFETLLRSSQKQQRKRVDQSLRKNQLCRTNKVNHEMSSRNKRQRRNDHANKPSYAVNDRKSQ